MSTTANRTRGAVPTRMAAAIAALSLLAMPVPAGAQGSGRTVLLTLTEGASLTQLADTVGALGGRVLATLELSDSLLVELPKGVGAPAGSAEIPDTPMKVNGTRTIAAGGAHLPRDDRRTQELPRRRESRSRSWTRGSRDVEGVKETWSTSTSLPRPRATDSDTAHSWQGSSVVRRFNGVAPGATMLDVQVADEEGTTSLSKVLAGLDEVGTARCGRREHQPVHGQPSAPVVRSTCPRPGAPLVQRRDRSRRGRQRGRRWLRSALRATAPSCSRSAPSTRTGMRIAVTTRWRPSARPGRVSGSPSLICGAGSLAGLNGLAGQHR